MQREILFQKIKKTNKNLLIFFDEDEFILCSEKMSKIYHKTKWKTNLYSIVRKKIKKLP